MRRILVPYHFAIQQFYECMFAKGKKREKRIRLNSYRSHEKKKKKLAINYDQGLAILVSDESASGHGVYQKSW